MHLTPKPTQRASLLLATLRCNHLLRVLLLPMSGSKRKEKAPSKLEWMPMQELPSLPAAPPTQRRANMAVAISSHPAYETASVGAVFRQPSLQQMPSPSFAELADVRARWECHQHVHRQRARFDLFLQQHYGPSVPIDF